ncbi:hypothetical protein [Methanobrevibacter sp.]|uniref:hypothetical protein n=1 Tax=Methanobrevibacter sp. TaxID=66852 RepID=UPI0038903816
MSESNFTPITLDFIEEINNTLKSPGSNYKLKNDELTKETFENQQDIELIQYVGDEEIELAFKTRFKNGSYYISSAFDIISGDLMDGREARDIFQSVNMYFRNVIANPGQDYAEEKESLINFLILSDEKYDRDTLEAQLNEKKITDDYNKDHERIYSQDDMTDIQKSLALKELVHMAICEVINDIDLFFTRPYDLSPAEEQEKNRQEAKALENELQLY